MHKKPKAVIFTGNRSEYGLLSPIIDALKGDAIDLKVLVAGDHHEAEQGYSRREIEGSGVAVIDLPYGKGCSNNNQKIAFLISQIDTFFSALEPDFLVIYGDRYETFAAAICAHQRYIKIIHLEGGDITEGGVQDDSVRHAISKLATFHLPSNAESARNLIRMGEEPWRVKVLGLSLAGYITDENYSDAFTVTAKYGLDERVTVLFTIHALPGSVADTEQLARESIRALLDLDPARFQIIITYPNSDPLGNLIIEIYRTIQRDNISVVPTLGRRDYHGILALNLRQQGRVVCAGNSSSGIKEAGCFKCVAVNIGDRQRSRLRSGVVIDCLMDAGEIKAAILQACRPAASAFDVEGYVNPYQSEVTPSDVHEMIMVYANDRNVLIKRHLLSERQT